MLKRDLLLKMNIQELFRLYPFVVRIFENFGLKCGSCLFSKNVNLEEALESSGVSATEIVEEIIKYLGEKDEGIYTCIHR